MGYRNRPELRGRIIILPTSLAVSTFPFHSEPSPLRCLNEQFSYTIFPDLLFSRSRHSTNAKRRDSLFILLLFQKAISRAMMLNMVGLDFVGRHLAFSPPRKRFPVGSCALDVHPFFPLFSHGEICVENFCLVSPWDDLHQRMTGTQVLLRQNASHLKMKMSECQNPG
jgi:hypothetical protein